MTIRSLLPLLLAACLPVLGQAPAGGKQESIKGVVRKNFAPVSTDLLRIKWPRPVERTLKNGLKVVILENHRVPVVALDLVISASTLNDPHGLPGVAQGVAEMMRLGTTTRSSRQIAEQVSEMAASLNLYAGWGSRTTHLNASAMKENLDPLLALAADVLLHPSFPQDEFDKWKKRQISSLEQMRAQPFFLGMERMNQVLYGGDARAFSSATRESTQKMTRDDLIAFYRRYYVPGSSILGVAGDITPDEIVSKLENVLGSWEPGTVADPDLKPKPPIQEKKMYLVHRPNSVQTFLMLGNHAIDRLSPDYIPCMVMNQVLGSGPASRLFINIREEKGFTYGVGSNFSAQKYLDQFSASSSVRTEVTGAALDEFLKEFRKAREEPVPKDELENAKRAIVARFALSIENQSSVLYQTLLLREYGLPDEYWDSYPEKIMAVTADDVQRVARKYVPLDNVQVVAVGDAARIREVLKKYGPVEEYDTEGKKAN